MSEVENVAEELQQSEVVQSEENHTDTETAESAQPSESSQEYNWRQLREKAQRAEEENRQLREYLRQQTAPQKAPEEEASIEIADDDLVEGRHVKKILSRVEGMLKKQEAASVPDRLQARFPDFNSVVTPENVTRLQEEQPEIFASIGANPHLFDRGVAAYKLIKALDAKQGAAAEKAVIEANRSRPGSSQGAVKQSPLSNADRFASGLTPQLKAELLKEMEDAIRA